MNRSKPIAVAGVEDTYMNPVFLSQKALYVSLGDSLPSPRNKPHREVFTVWMLDGVYHKFPYRPDMTLKELGDKISRKVFVDSLANEWVLLDGESSNTPLGPDTKLSALPSRAVRWIPELATTSNVRLQTGIDQMEYRRLVKKQLRIAPHPPLICGHAKELPKDIQKLMDRAGIDLDQAEKFFSTTCCLIRWITRRPIFMDAASLEAMREASLQKDEWGKKTADQLVPSLKPASKIIRKFGEQDLGLVRSRFKFDRGKEGQGGFGAGKDLLPFPLYSSSVFGH